MMLNSGKSVTAFVLFSLFLTLISKSAFAGASIDWELENGFRMFLNPEFTQIHRKEFESLSEAEKKNPILNIERRLSLKYDTGWAQKMYRATCWNRKRRTYGKCRGQKENYLHPKSHRVITHLKGEHSSEPCHWQLFRGIGSKRTRLRQVRQACNKPITLEIPYPTGAHLEVYKDKKLIARKMIKVTDVFIVGLGDSYASGEGNPDKPVKFNDKRNAHYGVLIGQDIKLDRFPAREGRWKWIGDRRFTRKRSGWQSEACHRSLYSYQLRAALQLALENKQRAVTYAGFSCSGAQMLVGLLDRYKGGNPWVKYPPKTSQINQASLAMCKPNTAKMVAHPTTYTMRGQLPSMENLNLYKCSRKKKEYRQIDFLLMSIGGNDVGFARIVANAILKDETALKELGGWVGQIYKVRHAEERLAELLVRYKAVNRALHNVLYIPWKQSDRIILTAYPKLGYREDGITICPNGKIGMDLHPVFNVNARKVMNGEVFSFKLNSVMRRVAGQYGWSYVEAHREQFGPHGYCASKQNTAKNTMESFAVPRLIDGQWQPYAPSSYRTYYPRQRWIRTPNDVYMGAHDHIDRKLLGKVFKLKNLNAFQLIYAGTYGGAFHPTAEGHAAIADAVAQKLKRLMKKYKY